MGAGARKDPHLTGEAVLLAPGRQHRGKTVNFLGPFPPLGHITITQFFFTQKLLVILNLNF